MRYFTFIFILFLPRLLQAQDISSILFSNYSVDYFGQITDKGSKKDGIGLYRLPKENLYAGDMKMNKIHGIGMMIIGEKGEISHCDGAYAYVGEWENGMKNGKGTVYDRSGTAIYNGNFTNDTPTDKYPNEEIDITKRFSYLELKKELYIGEVENGKPEGYGLTIDEEGFISLFPFKNGLENGVGIIIFPPNYWATFKAKDEQFFPISSSREQAQRTENNKIVAARARVELIQSLNNVLDAGVQLAETIKTAKNGDNTPNDGNNEDIYSTTDDRASSASHKSSSSSNKPPYNISEQQNYNRDKQTYSNYDGMLSAHFYGNRPATGSDVKQWQQAMKKIRTKWEAKGRNFPKFENEGHSTASCSNSSHAH